jgi:hypothetical protein
LRALLADLAGDTSLALEQECAVMQMNLDLFVSDELDGADVRLRHPHLWRHLQVCETCREDHDRLLDMLSAEAEGRLAQLPPRPAVPLVGRVEPWRVEIVPAPGRERPTLQFVFAPSYLRQSLRPAAVAGVRGASDLPADRLLLSYLAAPAEDEVMVQLYAHPDARRPGAGDLTFSLIAAAEPMPTSAELTWGERTWTVALGPDGDATIGPVPAADLPSDPAQAGACSLRLIF